MSNEKYTLPIENGKIVSYAWPGGYPVFYICKDGGILCPDCVQENLKLIQENIETESQADWRVIGSDINWEDSSLHCDNCSKRIQSAYSEDEV